MDQSQHIADHQRTIPAHTPGEWLLSGQTIYALDETGGCNRFSCQVQGGYSYHGRTVKERTPEAEILANAQVMVAAPDLSEVARFALEITQDVFDGKVDPVLALDAICDLAKPALAKARGEA